MPEEIYDLKELIFKIWDRHDNGDVSYDGAIQVSAIATCEMMTHYQHVLGLEQNSFAGVIECFLRGLKEIKIEMEMMENEDKV
jgi:hypothetical protein